MNPVIDELIEGFIANIATGLGLLHKAELYGQVLVLLYSHIDSLGLLDAPPTQIRASSGSFKNWVKKYMLADTRVNFNEVDFWSARCAVLHTFTSQSDLSNSGDARELQYYAGPKDSLQAKQFVATTLLIDDGKHLPVHIEDTLLVFLDALRKVPYDLSVNCKADSAYEKRLRKVLQQFSL